MNNDSTFLQAFLSRSRTFIRVDTEKEQLYVQKYRGEAYPEPDKPMKCGSFLDAFLAEDTVYLDDRWEFDQLKDTQALIHYCKNGRNGLALIYRRLEGVQLIWSRMELLIPEEHGADNPFLFLYVYDIDSVESAFYDSFSVFALRIVKIARCTLRDQHFMVIQEPQAERLRHQKTMITDYSDEVQFVGKNYIHSEDSEVFAKYMALDNLQRYFALGNAEYSFYCRRKLGGLYRWVRILVVPIEKWKKQGAVYYFYMEDVHTDLVKFIDVRNIRVFSKYFGGLYKNNIESYYENMLTVLHGLTQSYVDFYMVNLEKDLYIKYKYMSGTLKEQIPIVGSYSDSSIHYINEHCKGRQAEELSLYCTSEKLREAMRDRLILEYDFFSDEGVKLRTTCQKIESVHGTPTKVLCRTTVVHDENQLTVRTFGNFEVLAKDGTPIRFGRKQSKQLLAYLIDRQGYPVSSRDIVTDVLEKPEDDMNAIKYCSTLIRRTIRDLENSGFWNVIIKEQKTIRVNTSAVDCDYYHLLKGELAYLHRYHNEYMKEYSWAEDTNAEILSMVEKK